MIYQIEAWHWRALAKKKDDHLEEHPTCKRAALLKEKAKKRANKRHRSTIGQQKRARSKANYARGKRGEFRRQNGTN